MSAAQISRREFFKIAQAGLGCALLSFAQPIFEAAAAPVVLWSGRRQAPWLALTFDDCYSLSALLGLEELLEQHPAAKITLFPTGLALNYTRQQDPEVWPRLLAKGHEIGYHSFDHQMPSDLSKGQMLQDYALWLETATLALEQEPKVRFARPPFGERSNSFMYMCGQQDLMVAMWSTNWGGSAISGRREMKRMQGGDIVLVHTRYQDVENMAEALPLIAQNGLQAVTMSRLFDEADPETDADMIDRCDPERTIACPK